MHIRYISIIYIVHTTLNSTFRVFQLARQIVRTNWERQKKHPRSPRSISHTADRPTIRRARENSRYVIALLKTSELHIDVTHLYTECVVYIGIDRVCCDCKFVISDKNNESIVESTDGVNFRSM